MGDYHTIHGGHTMTGTTKALIEYLRKVELELDEDWLRQMVQNFTQAVIELEAEAQIGAGRHERSPSRLTQRNGYRERGLATRVGELDLRIPKLRQGSFFPSLLEPRRRVEKALVAVVQEAYVEGVSTRKVDDLLIALGLTGIDKSAVSRACKALDEVIEPFRNRVLTGPYAYLWLDALYLKVRQNHRIVSKALVIAIGVRDTGEREVVGWALGASEEQAFWQEFLRSLVGRGLTGVQLVISDAHEGLKAAIARLAALPGAFHAEPAGPHSPGRQKPGGRHRADHLRAAQPSRRSRASGPGRPHARSALAEGRRALAHGGARHLGLHELPA
jgi:transposase-like protein